jgi:hypothetical protein
MLNPSGGALEPFLHLVGDHLPGADQCQAARAAGDPRQLAGRQIVAPGQVDDPLPATLAGVALGDLWQGTGTVEIEFRSVASAIDNEAIDVMPSSLPLLRHGRGDVTCPPDAVASE